MGRSYGNKTIQRLVSSNQSSLSLKFAAACVDARLNTSLLANFFGVSRMTIHNWFHDKTMRPEKEAVINRFVDQILTDLRNGVLPKKNKKEMGTYLENLRV